MKNKNNITLRFANSDDLPFIRLMLFEAFFWDPAVTRPDFDLFMQTNPEFIKLLSHWGLLGDCGLIAEVDHQPAGAAWYRFWSEETHSYGYVNSQTPELGIGVLAQFRRQGIGRALLQRLLDTAQDTGIRRISLSVDPHNPALLLYQSLGFVRIGQSGTSWTMIRQT